jgi:hypothetical protein
VRARYSFVVLVILSLLIGVTSILFTVGYVNSANRKFCQVVSATTATPVQKPADPHANPSRENQWEWYERFAALGRSLGC